jgi:ferredoxin-NADP reductase
MILLVTSSERAPECAAAVKAATGEAVVVAENLALATARLREESYLAVVLDQHLLETEPHEAEIMLEHLDTAIPVQVNLAICGMERLVREVRAAVQRRHCEETRARQAALGHLQSELNGTITALLLLVELALETGGMSAVATEKVQSIHELVKKLRRQLAAADAMAEAELIARQ